MIVHFKVQENNNTVANKTALRDTDATLMFQAIKTVHIFLLCTYIKVKIQYVVTSSAKLGLPMLDIVWVSVLSHMYMHAFFILPECNTLRARPEIKGLLCTRKIISTKNMHGEFTMNKMLIIINLIST